MRVGIRQINKRRNGSPLLVENGARFDEWQEFADECKGATFFHTPLWYKVFSDTYRQYTIATKKIVFDDGKLAYFPLIEYRRRGTWTKHCISGPAGVYGGWLCHDLLDSVQTSQVIEWLFEHYSNITWRINPFVENALEVLKPYTTCGDTTEVLYLNQYNSFEDLRKNYKRSVRKEIRKAERLGLDIKIAQDWRDWKRYFEIYRDAMRRWGTNATSNYPELLFQKLHNLGSEKIKLWLVMNKDEIIGGNLNFYQNRHCVEWHAAFASEYFGSGMRNFLVDRIIEDAHTRGFQYYDFNPSGGHEGTRKFKQSFGTLQLSSDLIIRNKRRLNANTFLKVVGRNWNR